jgi:hypothetical protein
VIVTKKRFASAVGDSLDPASEAWASLVQELQRHRRHDRPLTVCRVDLDAIATGDRTPDLIAAAMVPRLRAGERVFAERRDLYLILPETEREQAALVLRRLSVETGVGDLAASFHAATFPDDALTASALARALTREPVATMESRRRPRRAS